MYSTGYSLTMNTLCKSATAITNPAYIHAIASHDANHAEMTASGSDGITSDY